MLRVKEESEPAEDIVLETRKRILKALLPAGILALLQEVNVSSATNIIRLVKERTGIKLSPGTVYPMIISLVKQGKIRQISYRKRNLYCVTAKGEAVCEQFKNNFEDLQNLFWHLLKK